MEHYRAPRNHGELTGMDVVRRLDNPLCGDELEVGVSVHAGQVVAVRYRARACSICMASGSLMTEAVAARDADGGLRLSGLIREWFGGVEGDVAPEGVPEALQALGVVLAYPTRRRCVTLPWEALEEALDSLT